MRHILLEIFLFVLIGLSIKGAKGQSNFSRKLINENAVIKIVEQKNDTLIVFTNTGYYIIPNKFEIDTSLFDISLKRETDFISVVKKKNDSTIWLAGRNNLFRMDKLNIKEFSFPSSSSIYDIDFDSEDNLYVGTWGDGLYKFDGVNWKNYTIESDSLIDDRVTCVKVDEEDIVWIGYHMNGIGFIDSTGTHNFEEDEYFNFPFDVADMLIHEGKIYICCWDGLYVFEDNHLTKVYMSDPIESITIDSADTLWMATYDNGLVKIHVKDVPSSGGFILDDSRYIHINNSTITKFPEDLTIDSHGKLWIASFNGINYFNNKWHLISQESLYHNSIQAIRFHKNYTWVCTTRGLSLLKNEKWKSYHNSCIKDQSVRNILTVNDSIIWVCKGDSILSFKFDTVTLELDLFKSYKFSSSVQCLTERNDTIYVGTTSTGILRYFSGTWDTIDVNNNNIKDFYIQDTVIWAVTSSGICRINYKGDITNYSHTTDIPVRYVYEISVDTNQNIWFSCSSGLLKNNNNTFSYFPSGSKYDYFHHITIDESNNIWSSDVRDALLFDEFQNKYIPIEDNWYSSSVNVISLDKNGDIWFGTSYGINTVLIDEINPPTDFDVSHYHPGGCTDRLNIIPTSSGYVESFEARIVDQSNAQVEMIGADTIGIYNIDNDSISIQIKGINTYFSSKWSDTILIVLDTTSNYFFEYKTICQGDSVLIGNNYEKEPVTFTDTLQNEYGCDSIIVTELIVHPTYSGTKQLSICQGDSVLIGSYYEKVPGIYADTLQNQFGCDSIIINHLSVDTCNSNYSNLHFKDCKIYPNPFSDFIIIANKNIVGDVLIKILDNKGAVLYEDSFNNNPEIKLKTEFLERGLYTVVLQSENEARQIKIIKIN